MTKVISVTGYKSYEMNINATNDERIKFIKLAIKRKLLQFIEQGGEWLLCSGQLGVELWSCQVARELAKDYPIQTAVIAPFENQDKLWNEADQQAYQTCIEQADFYTSLYKGDYKSPQQFTAKNKWLIEKSDCSMLLVDDMYPGSVRYYLDEVTSYQESQNHPVYFITPLDLEDIVREWNDMHNQ
ncbi:Uncharacterized SPBc2 prophage-derived protein YoqJ [Amphibacillus marinus]|uniref:Uncharacterized SPBc2 prophage-derived protein YoqJ n=1 Tax=Amphibacillus marinus TaxID=872970 RepID=A0A1H8GKW2_9BACI|nr:SLOG family protein [Amphibacillus marinus]SEN44425.1 Uncharacterized SPBc2 prophage-derived protein YoqJ [Amphibacillus marinus]